jgi:isoaspartyl peptidase/L-asparaginase-like protein (Ntn-hydrolase superfamily)
MDETPHVLLVGDGAKRFALAHGFEAENLLTQEARKAWEEQRGVTDGGTAANHDTVGMVALAGDGRMAAACTTSGLAWKLPGRVGDSPLIGHGLYCDERAGAAVATGFGEDVIRVCGSYQTVEFMRQGMEPEAAVRTVLQRILVRPGAERDHQVGLIALRADGRVGYASLNAGFQVTLSQDRDTRIFDAPALLGGTEES